MSNFLSAVCVCVTLKFKRIIQRSMTVLCIIWKVRYISWLPFSYSLSYFVTSSLNKNANKRVWLSLRNISCHFFHHLAQWELCFWDGVSWNPCIMTHVCFQIQQCVLCGDDTKLMSCIAQLYMKIYSFAQSNIEKWFY